MTVIDLGARRAPVIYTVTMIEGYDGSLTIEVHDVQDDPRSRFAVADSLSRASDLIKERCRESA
jgi:hypothetical protein